MDLTYIDQYYSIAVNADSTVCFRDPSGNGNTYAAIESSAYSGYIYMTMQPEYVILEPVHKLIQIIILVAVIFLLLTLLISHHLSRSIVRPIDHLKHIIQRMELDTLGVERATSYPVSIDELEELYLAFQNMSDHLNHSMNQLIETQQQELKSRSLALQMQINPHFYYNSLSSIAVLAENDNKEEIYTMCRSLSNIMRYITDSSHTIVKLADEIDYVKKYLYCMKIRYQSSLNYTIDIPDSLLELQVPKLIVQPLVENAIKYGSDCEPPWYICVRGVVEDDYWKIEIIDSGNGFSDEALKKISENIQKASVNPSMPELQINGLGTLNVYLRWKLFCKDQIIFTCGNTEDGHGIVSIGSYTHQKKEERK